MPTPRVQTEVAVGQEKLHRTVMATSINDLIKVRPPNDRTEAEVAAGVTPVNQSYRVGDIRRYGAIADGPDCQPALQAAINVAAASANLGCAVYIPQGTWHLFSGVTYGTNSVNVYGDGKFLSILYARSFAFDAPIFTCPGTNANRIAAVYMRDFALASDNNQARGITASYMIFTAFENLYFYQLYNGFVGDVCFANNVSKFSSFGMTLDCWTLNDECNNWHFDTARLVGRYGVHVTGHAHALKFSGIDAEGILTADGVPAHCAAIRLAPAAGKVVHSVDVSGCYSEDVQGYFLSCDGVDANSVRGLHVHANYITGGFAAHFASAAGNASHAIKLFNVLGFDIHDNFFTDWEIDAIQTNGSERNGSITNNPATLTPVLAAGGLHSSVYSRNNFEGRGEQWTTTNLISSPTAASISDLGWNSNLAGSGSGGGGGPLVYGAVAASTFAGFGEPLKNVTLAYSALIALNAALGDVFTITATNGVAFTVNNPTNGFTGQRIRVRIRNTSGGALGAVTWAAFFKVGSWTSPATANSRCIDFDYDGTNWVQSTTAADVPN